MAMKMNAMEVVFTEGNPTFQKISVELPKPASDDEIRVKVKFAALDTGTEAILAKDFNGTFIHNTKIKPLIIGWHYAGVVDAVGSEVTAFKIGDDVFGFLDYASNQTQGSFSEYIVVEEKKTALKPKDVPFDVAAASACEAVTALQAMRDEGGLSPQDKILILGSSGGVGSAAVMIAKNLGAHVTAVCSINTKHVDRVKAMGADVVIDRNKQPNYLSTLEETKFNVVFDVPNSTSWWDTKDILEKNGTYVATVPSISFFRDVLLSTFSSQKVKTLMCEAKRDDFELVGKWLEEGTLKIDIDSQYKVSDLNEAMKRQENKNKIGRVVIQVENGWQ